MKIETFVVLLTFQQAMIKQKLFSVLILFWRLMFLIRLDLFAGLYIDGTNSMSPSER